MSVSNGEFHHFTSFRSGFDPTWFNHYDRTRISGAAAQPAKEPEDKNKEHVTELNVNLCCEGCVQKVYKKVKAMDGVANVHCDPDQNKVTVTGPAKPERVLKEVRKISHLSGSTLWKKK